MMASYFVSSVAILRDGLPRATLRVAALFGCLFAWHLATGQRIDLGFITFRNVPSPREVAESAWALAQSPLVLEHLGASLRRVFIGFGLAVALGVALGLAIGRARWAEDALLPPLEVLRPIPAVAWIPLAILMFPSSEASMVFITFVGALFPVLLNTVHGVEAVDARLVASARSLGAGRFAVFREVVLPGALPSIVTGLAIGMGTAWFCRACPPRSRASSASATTRGCRTRSRTTPTSWWACSASACSAWAAVRSCAGRASC